MWLRLLALFGCISCGLYSQAASSALQYSIQQEAETKLNALIKEGFNLTYHFSLDPVEKKGPTRIELLFPEDEEEPRVVIWMQAKHGEISVRLTPADGTSILGWTGRKGELHLQRHMPRGLCTLELSSTQGGEALFCVKGPTVIVPRLDTARFQERSALPSKGFHWPYFLYVPEKVKTPHLLVVPNNTGFATEDLELLRATSAQEAKRLSKLADRLGCALLVPMFPRPGRGEVNLYLHALTRDSLLETKAPLKRVDLQLLAMIDDAQSVLNVRGLKTDPRILMWGFSASGSFVNRFAFLHPDRVLAVACGSPGGWPIAPLEKLNGATLTYPIGLGDLKALTGRSADFKQAQRVAWFLYLGDQDTNDAVPYRDSFSEADEAFVTKHFGSTPVSRWSAVQKLYTQQGMKATFTLYPDVAHSVTPAIQADIATFFEGKIHP